MEVVIYLLRNLCVSLISIVQLAMFVRAILSWIPLDDDNKFEAFLIGITEPIIYPVRVLLDRFDSLRTIPLDIPFFVTFLLLSVLSTVLSSYG